MDRYVLLDTNVLIYASLRYVTEDLSIEFESPEYSISKGLLNFISKENLGVIGVITADIENSAQTQLNNAIIYLIEKKGFENKVDKERLFKNSSSILTECTRRLKENLRILRREPIPDSGIKKFYGAVSAMYWSVKQEIIKNNPYEEAKEKKAGLFDKRYAVGYDVPPKVAKTYKKLRRKFIESFPSNNDIVILSSAIYLKNRYSSKKENFVIASNDADFSAIKDGDDYWGTLVPSTIESKFDIICERPEEVLKRLKK